FHSGCCGSSAFTRSSTNANWKYNGCSAQSLPSLSKVAIRSLGGTKSGASSFVTFSTKATIAFFGAVLFHEGKGSCARAGIENINKQSTKAASFVFIQMAPPTAGLNLIHATRHRTPQRTLATSEE